MQTRNFKNEKYLTIRVAVVVDYAETVSTKSATTRTYNKVANTKYFAKPFKPVGMGPRYSCYDQSRKSRDTGP